MNTLTIAVAELLQFKKDTDKDTAIFNGENEFGKYISFRVKENRGKGMPNYFLCLLNSDNDKLFQRITHMKLVPGDLVSIEGCLDMYIDKGSKKNSFRVIVKDIDYAVKKKKTAETKETESHLPASINLNDEDPFIKKVEY